MTYRRTFAIVALGVTLSLGSHVAVARAYEPCDDQTDNRCVQGVTDIWGLSPPASIATPVCITTDDLAPLRGHEQAMTSTTAATP